MAQKVINSLILILNNFFVSRDVVFHEHIFSFFTPHSITHPPSSDSNPSDPQPFIPFFMDHDASPSQILSNIPTDQTVQPSPVCQDFAHTDPSHLSTTDYSSQSTVSPSPCTGSESVLSSSLPASSPILASTLPARKSSRSRHAPSYL